jgi:hypothetical protein
MTITRAPNRSARSVARKAYVAARYRGEYADHMPPEEAERIWVSRGELIYVCRS